MTESFFKGLLEKSRFLTVLYDNLPDEIKTDKLYSYIELYLKKYTSLNNISEENAIDVYTNFVSIFNKHCKQFGKSGKYPFENGSAQFSMSREEYDIVLLLSVLFTPHRFRIMQLVFEKNSAERALFIGLGPGLELSLTKGNFKEIHAYDLSVNNFLFSEFPDIKLNIELYTGQKENYFDVIYLVELLEHLEDPFVLLRVCHKSLKEGGKVFITTATDIPQFDHLYNFPKDHSYFEEKLSELGFSVLFKEMIPHNYLKMEIKPFNHFYIIEKM
jgi:SAM-dependent methyltransferase